MNIFSVTLMSMDHYLVMVQAAMTAWTLHSGIIVSIHINFTRLYILLLVSQVSAYSLFTSHVLLIACHPILNLSVLHLQSACPDFWSLSPAPCPDLSALLLTLDFTRFC